MDIHFIKLHCAGRDFILIDGFNDQLNVTELSLDELFKTMTHRTFCVGGDGLIFVKAGKSSPVSVEIYTESEMRREPHPHALLCAARFAFDAGHLGKKQTRIEMEGRQFNVMILDSKDVTVNIGPPSHQLGELKESINVSIHSTIPIRGRKYSFTPLEILGFHFVLFEPATKINLQSVGRSCARLSSPPPQVELVRVDSPEEIRVRAWNPVGGELLSSVAGDAAAVVASAFHGFTDRDVLVHNRGGDIYVRWEEESNDILISGSVEYSFIGTYYWEN